jgi:hypothetical protein
MRAVRTAALVGVLATAFAPGVRAQTAADSVRATVQEFFRTMTARDSAGARRTLLEADGQYWAMRPTPQGPSVQRRTNAPYLESLGKPGPRWQERMWDPTIQVHGPLATLWAPYDFHIDGTFSHCGVDTFTLFRTGEGWRIATVAYTVETEGCAPSPLGPLAPASDR